MEGMATWFRWPLAVSVASWSFTVLFGEAYFREFLQNEDQWSYGFYFTQWCVEYEICLPLTVLCFMFTKHSPQAYCLLLTSFRAASIYAHPFALHFSMFMETIKGQGTDEQIAEFLPKAQRLEIIGTYAQTELGHGRHLSVNQAWCVLYSAWYHLSYSELHSHVTFVEKICNYFEYYQYVLFCGGICNYFYANN